MAWNSRLSVTFWRKEWVGHAARERIIWLPRWVLSWTRSEIYQKCENTAQTHLCILGLHVLVSRTRPLKEEAPDG